ncbi:hypothetical protein OOK41_31745 [Micromonospora sp. NBC_01655]|uniref:hypothetical protein n=1 Tax=Micromonospora sp. NBC_01655 TaxID=2975983 RepID=UPI00225A70D2|nr:hypothetical protein [Micromonospora sp. NBC_01655]MCX4474835.1 hypothetical protein [Micromonospora sp. NBC_01655]
MRQHFISTTATEARCPRCHAALLTALDEGLPVRVDATPLPDRAAEINALLDGRWTYTHTANKHLVIRDEHRIAANTMRGTVHAEHKCTGPTQLTIEDLIGEK